MKLQGINHLCFSVSDLAKSVDFYQKAFDAKLLVTGRSLAYFDLNGLWLALNQEEADRSRYTRTYTHIAFTIEEGDWNNWMDKLEQAGAEVLPGRARDERDHRSVYFLDPDGHMFEFHTGTLADRMEYYKTDKPHMQFFD
ncbi:metallothiol transferase FosB [Fontibacillus sp. BL9]|uniref:metallothiol transferase FosB n=1 Tax=Fontibacillus sp. BL9 TaxID=3389971 RepID=UPI003978481D